MSLGTSTSVLLVGLVERRGSSAGISHIRWAGANDGWWPLSGGLIGLPVTIAVDAFAFQSVTVSARAEVTEATSTARPTADTAAARPENNLVALTTR